MSIAEHLVQPTRAAVRKRTCLNFTTQARHPYSVLLPVGFTMPLTLLPTRCALTAPFHPYLIKTKRFTFCGTFPEVTLAGRYPAPCLRGARTFLPSKIEILKRQPSSHLTGET